MRTTDFINSYTKTNEEKKGLYYYVNKRKKAGTSRSKNNPKAPSAQDWKNAAKTAKKESVEEGPGNVGDTIRELYQQIYDQGDDALEYLNSSAPLFAQFWDQYEGDLDSIIAEVSPKNLIRIAKELKAIAGQEGVAEGRDTCPVCGQTPCNCTHINEEQDDFASSKRAKTSIAASNWKRGGEVTGTSLKGYITTTYDDLVNVFGEPYYGPDDNGDKITCEWIVTFKDGTVATIYDWKVGETPRGQYRWHIGGVDQRAVEYVGSLLAGRGETSVGMWEGRTGLYVDGTLKRVFESYAIAEQLLDKAAAWFPYSEVKLQAISEDATGGASCSSAVAAVVTELGDGGMSKRQLNSKLGKYTNIARKPKQVKVRGAY